MKSDSYTKFVLTVIALSLSVIAIQLTTKEANAQTQGFMFSPSGALMVTLCHPAGNRYRWACADVDGDSGVAVTVKR